MITCTLNGKKYTVDFITGRALREMEPAAKMYSRIVALSNAALKGESPQDAKELSIGEAMDVMIRWFCVLFGNQFTPDDVRPTTCWITTRWTGSCTTSRWRSWPCRRRRRRFSASSLRRRRGRRPRRRPPDAA